MNTKIVRALVLAGAFFLAAGAARAQNQTHITATVTDPQGVPYANATVSMTLVPSGVNPTVNGQQIGGQANTRLDANGVLDYSLFSNAAIVPANTKWFFQVTESPGVAPPLGTGTQTFSTTLTISGASQSLTSTFNALAPKLTTITVGGGAPAGCTISSGILTCTGFIAAIMNFATTPEAVLVTNAAAPLGDFVSVQLDDTGNAGFVASTHGPCGAPPLSAFFFADDGTFNLAPCAGGGWVTDTSGNTCVPDVGFTCFDGSGNIRMGQGDFINFQGAINGSAPIGAAPNAGTSSRINLPTTTGAANACLQTDGGTPQQTSWAGCSLTIASGTAALATAAIASGTCAAAVSPTATGALTTDTVSADFNADPTGVTGYIPSAAGMLTIIKYSTAGNVNFKVCNNTGASITPGAITLNWRVVR